MIRANPLGLGIVLVCLHAPTVAPGQEAPCAVFFYGHYTQAEARFARSVVADYEIEPDPGLAAKIRRKEFFRYDAPSDFIKREGIAYYVVPNDPNLMVVRFVPMPSKKSFEQFVRHMAELLGPNTLVSGAQNLITLRPPNGTPEFLRYDDRGIAIKGWEPIVHTIPLAPLIDANEAARNKHSFFSVRPGIIPKETRRSVLKQVSALQSAALQQRDQEPKPQYAARKLLGTAWKQITEALVLEVTEVTLWYSLPTEQQPFKASLEATFTEGGSIDRTVRRLSQNRRRIRVTDNDTLVASCQAALNLSREDVTLLTGISDRLPEAFQKLIAPVLVQDFELAIVLTDLGIGEPVAIICTPTHARDDGALNSEFQLPEVGSVRSAQRSATLGATPLTLLQLSRSQLSDATVPIDDIFAEERAIARPYLLDAEVNLSHWATRINGTESEKFIRWLEQSVDAWEHRKLLARIPANLDPRIRSQFFPYRPTLDPSDFQSLAPRLSASGQWKGRLTVRPGSQSIVANLELGNELYRWVVARQLLARIRARKP